MSKHWDPRTFQTRRTWRLSWSEIRVTLLGGVFLGLAYGLIPAREAKVPGWDVEAPDPWAESRRSRVILERQEAAPPSEIEPRSKSSHRVVGSGDAVDVIDGDTFDVGGQRIRIADIDTPEVKGPCAYERQLAARATTRMAELLGAGAFELHPIDRETDQYGRKLRVVTRDGRSLGDQMVAEGLARTWTGRRQPWC